MLPGYILYPMVRCVLVFSLLLSFHLSSHAHDLGIEVKVRGDKVELEVFFDDGTPAALAPIKVTTSNQTLLVEGKTDAEGRWSFSTPEPGHYRITADAGPGHRRSVDLTIPASISNETMTQGTPRSEFTRTRWKGLALGTCLLAMLPLLARMVSRSVRPQGGAITDTSSAST